MCAWILTGSLAFGCGGEALQAGSAASDRLDDATSSPRCIGLELDGRLEQWSQLRPGADELACIAQTYAASSDPQTLATLGTELGREAFLHQLDDAEQYTGTYDQLRLGRVLDTLAANPAPAARHTLVSLMESEVFLGNVLRVQLYLRAFRDVRPLPDAIVSLLDALAVPDSPIGHDVMAVLLENQSAAAMRLVEAKLLAENVPRVQKQAWLREALIGHRYDDAVLDLARRIMDRTDHQSLKVDLVETLFDYKPDDWYVIENVVEPPRPDDLSPQQQVKLKAIATAALESLALTDSLRRRVTSTLRTLD
jgi:hypothetical protein